jgi:hypothetical protein
MQLFITDGIFAFWQASLPLQLPSMHTLPVKPMQALDLKGEVVVVNVQHFDAPAAVQVAKQLVPPVGSLLSKPFVQVTNALQVLEVILITLMLAITSVPLAAVSSGFKIPVSTSTALLWFRFRLSSILAEVGLLVGVEVKPFTAVSVPRRTSLDDSTMSATTTVLNWNINTVDRRVVTPLE